MAQRRRGGAYRIPLVPSEFFDLFVGETVDVFLREVMDSHLLCFCLRSLKPDRFVLSDLSSLGVPLHLGSRFIASFANSFDA
jgi:hypothetical protein